MYSHVKFLYDGTHRVVGIFLCIKDVSEIVLQDIKDRCDVPQVGFFRMNSHIIFMDFHMNSIAVLNEFALIIEECLSKTS